MRDKRHNAKVMGLTVILLLSGGFLFAQADSVKTTPIQLGEQVSFFSSVLGEQRSVNVWLPPHYSPDSIDYPVIYLLDGGMDEDFIHVTGVVQFNTFPWVMTMPECIVVGIVNVDRRRDFTFPTTIEQDKKDYPTSGGSAAFMRFMQRELFPLIESKYAANQQRTIVGQSLGGLLAAEILINHPEMFQRYVIVSPSLWWDNESLLKQSPVPSDPVSVYIAVGEEGDIMKRTARELFERVADEYLGDASFDFLNEYDHATIGHEAVFRGLDKVWK